MKRYHSLTEGVTKLPNNKYTVKGKHHPPLWSISDIAEFLGIPRTALGSALGHREDAPRPAAQTTRKKVLYDKEEVVRFWNSIPHPILEKRK